MVNFPVKLPPKHHFLVTPTNIGIIEITPAPRASNYDKRLCAHFIVFDKTYNFMKITCISCIIFNTELCSTPFP